MTLIIWLLLLVAIFVALSKIFVKAGEDSWKAFVPGLNFYVWLKIIEKPWWWLFLLIFPGPNVLMLMIMCVNLATVLDRRESKDVVLAAFVPFIYLNMLGFDEKVKYVGPIDRKKFKKTSTQEWRDAILFAIVAASIIRTYFLEAFTIPTPSMEKSMLVGDYLFVSKLSYGPKVPQTPLSFPFAHHSLPNTTIPSYLDWIKLPYHRLPGLGGIERNDVVVFNYPEGDTVDIEFQANKSVNAYINELAFQYRAIDFINKAPIRSHEYYQNKAKRNIDNERQLTVRPVDKRENYIKRCVALPGDKIEIKDGILFVNGKQGEMPEDMQYNYYANTAGQFVLNRKNSDKLKKQFNINYASFKDSPFNPLNSKHNRFYFPLTHEKQEEMARDNAFKSVDRYIHKKNEFGMVTNLILKNSFRQDFTDYLINQKDYDPLRYVFPNNPKYDWTEDSFGPLVIPAEGATVNLTVDNLPIYKRLITVYEHNELRVKDGKIFINGEETSSYTFKMNYYWLMGDNRHNSMDSRFWGFVPEDHVVGKALFIWMSLDPELGFSEGKIRWNRFFKLVD